MFKLKQQFSVRRILNFNCRTFQTGQELKTECNDNYLDEILHGDKEYLNLTESYLNTKQAYNCYVIQPYIKWGSQKLKLVTPDEQLDEAKALIHTLPRWNVKDRIAVPLESFEQKSLFKSGTMDKLRNAVRTANGINAVFVNLGTLKKHQIQSLEQEFSLPVFDRYKIVMQILKIHATTKHAKLQVAMAELYYFQRNVVGNLFAINAKEKYKLIMQNREQKLKEAIKDLRKQRSLLRVKRQKSEYPMIAVVGYTNAGKTSLIKTLTGDDKLQPKNQLFATLDVTVHSGMLPSGLDVLYVDTVGFLSDIPTNLIECFNATLEDAVLADIILHVEDVSSSSFTFKREHVLKTLQHLCTSIGDNSVMDKILNVGNKCDLCENVAYDGLKVSALTDVGKSSPTVSEKNEPKGGSLRINGLDVLRLQLENDIIRHTNRQKLQIKLPAGGQELYWLYKNATIASERADKTNEFIYANVIITNPKLQQFKHIFLNQKQPSR